MCPGYEMNLKTFILLSLCEQSGLKDGKLASALLFQIHILSVSIHIELAVKTSHIET